MRTPTAFIESYNRMETAMNNNSGSFANAKDNIEKLIELKIDQVKLQSTDSLAKLFSRILTAFIILLLTGILTGFLAIAFAVWIGRLFGSTALGMLSSAILVGLIILFLYLKRETLFLNSMTKLFIKLLFPNDKAA